jgi:hypothetical protein
MTKVCADDACTVVGVKLGLKAQVAPWWLHVRIFSFAFITRSATFVGMNWGWPISIFLAFTAALAAAEPALWSLERLQKPVAPASGEWGRTAVDGFVAAKLQAANLSPQPEADRHTLIRRLTLGLTGLPPTVAGMEQFVRDTKPGAYERLVDRLLAKPAFGERWGRHWLDVVRFGESSGQLTVDADKPRANAWRFRDAVIRALNEDVPFDQFVRFHFVPEGKKQGAGAVHSSGYAAAG